jgi:hypothetical protein
MLINLNQVNLFSLRYRRRNTILTREELFDEEC